MTALSITGVPGGLLGGSKQGAPPTPPHPNPKHTLRLTPCCLCVYVLMCFVVAAGQDEEVRGEIKKSEADILGTSCSIM